MPVAKVAALMVASVSLFLFAEGIARIGGDLTLPRIAIQLAVAPLILLVCAGDIRWGMLAAAATLGGVLGTLRSAFAWSDHELFSLSRIAFHLALVPAFLVWIRHDRSQLSHPQE